LPQALSESHFDVDDREVNLKEEIKQKTEKKLIQDDLEMLRSNPTKISNSINNSLLEKEIREKKKSPIFIMKQMKTSGTSRLKTKLLFKSHANQKAVKLSCSEREPMSTPSYLLFP